MSFFADATRSKLKRSRLKLAAVAYKKLCDTVYERDIWRCKVCRYRHDLHAHHIIFRSQGGDDASYNLTTLCSDCHEALHMRFVVLLPLVEGDDINADKGFKILRVNNWKPKRNVI